MINNLIPAKFLQAMNASAFLLCLFILLYLCCYIFMRLKTHRWHYRRAHEDIAVAVPVFTLVLGDFIIRCSILWAQVRVNWHLRSTSEVYSSAIILSMAFGIAVLFGGGMCLMRILLRERVGNWGWMLCGVVSLLFGWYMSL